MKLEKASATPPTHNTDNKKFCEEVIHLLSVHTSLHAMVAIVTLAKDCM
jgi:hypothetical protein